MTRYRYTRKDGRKFLHYVITNAIRGVFKTESPGRIDDAANAVLEAFRNLKLGVYNKPLRDVPEPEERDPHVPQRFIDPRSKTERDPRS